MDKTLDELRAALKPKERIYAELIEQGVSGTEAALAAGYGGNKPDEESRRKTAATASSRLLKREDILAYRRGLSQQALKSIDIDVTRVWRRLEEIYQRCMAAVPVQEWSSIDGQWIETGRYEFDAKGATRCVELMGKALGLFADSVRVSTGGMGIEDFLRKMDEGKNAEER